MRGENTLRVGVNLEFRKLWQKLRSNVNISTAAVPKRRDSQQSSHLFQESIQN